jgi:cytochrome oxidase assembly protein ShyY1
MRAVKLAFSPRWLGYLALAVAFALVSGVFGVWQWDRREQAVAEIRLIENNYDLAALPIGQVLPDGGEWSDQLRWRPVSMEGQYVVEEQLLVRTRPRQGNVGFNVVVPFVTTDGHVFVIDRGWVPTGETRDEPDFVPPAPVGEIRVEARLFPSEPELTGRSAPPGQVASIALVLIDELSEHNVDQRAYGQLVSETPAPSSRPFPALVPVPDEGPHLSYSIQWFVFGLLGFIAWGYLFVQEYRYGPADKTTKPKKKLNEDELFEDDAYDAIENRLPGGRVRATSD